MLIRELIVVLREAQLKLGVDAPIYIYTDDESYEEGETLYDMDIKVIPQGSLGPGSVLLKSKKP